MLSVQFEKPSLQREKPSGTSYHMIIFMIPYVISYMISYCEQDCVVLLAPYPNNLNPVESFNIKTDFYLQGDGLVWRGMLAFNSSSTVPCVQRALRLHGIAVLTRRYDIIVMIWTMIS